MSTTGRGRGRGRRPEARSDTPSSVGGESMSGMSGMSEITSGMSVVSLSSSVSTSPMSKKESPSMDSGQQSGRSTGTAELEVVSALLTRPGFGTVGQKIPLKANYYRLAISGEVFIHRYEVGILRPGKDRKLDRDVCRAVFWRAADENRHIFGKFENLVYDDANCLWTREKLGMDRGEQIIQLNRQDGKPEFVVGLKYTTSFVVDLVRDEPSRCTGVQFLDALITQGIRCPFRDTSELFYPFGRSVYLIPRNNGIGWSVPVGSGIEAWTGLHGAIKVDQQGNPLFNADVSTSAFYKIDMSLLDFYLEILNDFKRGGPRQTRQNFAANPDIAMDEHSRRSLKKALTGVNLRTTYPVGPSGQRDLKFFDVCGPATVVRFVYRDRDTGEEQELTIQEYFARFKGIRLQFPNLPVIQVGPRQKKICIPMELLKISDNAQKVKKELSEFQKSKLIRGAAMKPEERKSRIANMIGRQDLKNDNFLVNYGLSVDKELLSLNGRVLPPPVLELYTVQGNAPFFINVEEGKWPLRNQFTSSPTGLILSFVIVDHCVNPRDINGPYAVLGRACGNFGMQFSYDGAPRIVDWSSGSREDLKGIVRKEVEFWDHNCPKSNLLLLFLMSNKHAPTYGLIKTVCDIDEGVACQVILTKTFITMNTGNAETNATAHNICMKINVKMGGINNKILPPRYEIWPKFINEKEPTMFVGIDVTHPRPGRRGNSIATVVSSMDLEATRYESSIKVQLPGAERVVYMVESLKERLLSFYKANGRSPAHIVMYRDGISESEFLDTVREELGSALAACKKLEPSYSPTITYIVVQKRHHTRFFLENQRDGCPPNFNIPPGTVVDESICSSYLFDFFLSSHFGAIGTSRPSHYFVLYDSWKLSANDWQLVTFALCHLYGRCARSVSIPAPVFYAHLACARASAHDDVLFGGSRSSPGSSAHERDRSELETTRTQQRELNINRSAPRMYFV